MALRAVIGRNAILEAEQGPRGVIFRLPSLTRVAQPRQRVRMLTSIFYGSAMGGRVDRVYFRGALVDV